jgi:hypothetical protein
LCISLGRSTTGRIGVADRDIPMVRSEIAAVA